MGASDHISSGGMISTDFILFYSFWIFRLFICFLFFLGIILVFFGFLYIFKCFWSQASQGGTTGRPITPTFVVREFSVLTRLKTIHGNPEGFRVPNYPSALVVSDLL